MKNLKMNSLFKLVNVSQRGLQEVAWMPRIFSSTTAATPELSVEMCWTAGSWNVRDIKGNCFGGFSEKREQTYWIT